MCRAGRERLTEKTHKQAAKAEGSRGYLKTFLLWWWLGDLRLGDLRRLLDGLWVFFGLLDLLRLDLSRFGVAVATVRSRKSVMRLRARFTDTMLDWKGFSLLRGGARNQEDFAWHFAVNVRNVVCLVLEWVVGSTGGGGWDKGRQWLGCWLIIG